MLNIAVATADAVQQSSNFGIWRAFGVEAGPVIADLKYCRDKILRRSDRQRRHRSISLVKTVLHHQRLVRLRPPRLSLFLMSLRSETFKLLTCNINLVCFFEVGLCRVPEKSKKGRVPVVSRRNFSAGSPSASHHSFEAAHDKNFHESGATKNGLDRCNAPVFQEGYK